MDPQNQFCHNPACPDRGQGRGGNIGIHSRQEQHYRCSTCGTDLPIIAGLWVSCCSLRYLCLPGLCPSGGGVYLSRSTDQ